MALTNQQVQQAYLSVLGRPAEGDAVLWGSLATDVPGLINTIITIRNGVDFNKDNTIFVQNLYENLLGRTGDDEGLSFWVAALNAGMNHGELVTSFISSAAQTLNDLYTIQNKLALAEQISTQIKTIKGGAPAEAKLKALMNTIDDKTSINDIQEDINHFIGQFNEAKKVTVKPGADEPTIGSDEHASTYNATVNLNDEKTNLNIEGSTSFDDTLNLTVKGSSSNNTFNSSDIGQLSNLNTINLNLRDSRLTNSNITTSDLGAQNLKIKGTSADNITVNSQMSLLDTGDGGDTLSVNKSVESIKTGKGNDKVTINAKVGTLDTSAGNDNIKVNAQVNSIDAGSGNDIIDLAAGSKINKLNAGAGDDIINISQKANIKNALIDGGAGFNSLKLYDGLVDLTQTTLSGINALSGEARLKLSQIGAQNFILGVERLDNFAEPTGVFDSAKLEIKAEQGSMDLSKLAIAQDSTGHELKILDVKNSAIKLNDNNLGNSDGSDSTKVSVYGTDGNDTITIESGKVSLLDSLSGNDTITISKAASIAILNANDGKNKITIAGKVGTLTTKSGDDNISVSGEAGTINTNDGNDIINISGQANRLDTGAGNDNISLSGALKELNAGSGNDTININQGAKIRDLKAGDGDDIISIQKGADINNAKIDGGSGFNSLKLSNGEVDLSKTSLNNISAISGEAKLQANQVNNKSLTLGTGQKDNYGDPSGVFDSATLNIQADKADLSLNNLKIASGSKNHTINIQNAKESQISLNDKNLGNDGIDDVEVFASKVNVAGTANKDKITLKEGKFASLDANNGNDIINIEKGASLASLKAGDGNDTINIKGKVSELDAGNGDDDVIVEKDAEVKKLNAGAGDDIIRVKNGAKIELIDGNTGNDTLAFDQSSGGTSQTPTDISKTTISNIEILDGFGLLSAKQINGQSFILGGDKNKEVDGQKLLGNAKLQVKSDDLTNINLANLKSQTGVKDNTVEIQDVSEGKITLSDAKQYIKETIKLTANAHSVDISNIKGGDKIDFENIQKLTGSTGTGTNSAASSPEALDNSTNKTISSSKLYTINLVNGSVDDLSSLDSTLSTYSVSTGANALLAINQNGKAHIFKVNGPSTTSKLNSNMLKLLAITDSEINLGTTKVIGNTIEINGSVTITINKGDTKVQSAGNADTVFVGSVDISQADQGTPNKETQIIGSKDFTDTLAIQITSGSSTGGTTQKLDKSNFEKIVDTSKVKDVENLTLSTGSVEVDLELTNTNGNFQNEVTIAGSGTTKLQVKQDTQKISLGSGSGDVTVSSASVGDLNLGGGQNTLKVENSGKIGEVTGSNEKDTITISGSGSVDKITTNGGADTITLSGNGTLKTLEASSGSDTVTISGSGSISHITGEGKVTIADQTTLNNTLDIGSYKNKLTISGSSANVKNLLADDNKIKLEANSQIEKLQIKDGGNVSVSGSGSITFDTTNDTGTHTLTVGQDTTLKTFTAGSGDDTITIANGGKLSGDKIGLTNGNNTLNIASGGNVSALTTITTGNGTNKITIDKDATASQLANINLGNGTNTLDLSVSGATNGITVSGGSGTDNINLSGTNGKIATLNAGANSTNISLKANDNTITTINANDKGSTINIASGSGTITTIEGKSGADSISIGKGNTISEIKTGTGAISIDGEGTITKVTVSQNASGDISIGNGTKTTVNELVAGNNSTNQNINFDQGSVITTLKAASGGTLTLNGNGEVTTLNLSGATTENITIANGASVKNFTTDQNGSDNITVANGGKLDVTDTSKTLNFSGGNDKLEVQSGGDISTITTITMGDGSGSVTLKDGAKADKLATINLGNGDNNLDLGISGAANGLTVSGGSGTDTIKVSGAGKITTLNAGQNATNIELKDGGSISTIHANNTASSTISVSGSGYIDKIAGNTQDDTITLGKDITVGTIDAGVNKTTTINGGNITTLSTKSTGNVSVKVDQKANIKTIDTSSTGGPVTISGASTVDSLTVAGEVTISGASTVNSLTTTSSGAITISGAGTTLKNDLNGKSGANNKITIADGAKVDGTINLKAAGDDTRGASTSGDVVNISGANTVVNKIDTDSGVKTITLENGTINTIDAGYKKNDILLSGSGTVKELITGDTASSDTHKIQIGGNDTSKMLSVEKFTAGTGKDEITVASGGKILNQEINLNNGDNTFSVSGDISGANKILTGSGANTITLSDGAKLKDNLMVDFSNAGDKASTLAMNASGSISVTASKNTTISVSGANTDNSKAKIDTLKAGTGTTTINFTDNAKIKTINANEQADSTITVSGTGTIENISGSDTKDTININDANSKITNLYAGASGTDITFSGGATITTLNVSKSGSEINIRNTSTTDATITKLSTANGTGTHKIDVDNKVKIAGFEAGSGDDSITVKSGGTISATSLDFKSGTNTLDLKSGANIASLTTLKMGDGGNANLTIEDGVTFGTSALNISLGTASNEQGAKNTFTLKASGDKITLSGSSSLDDITVAGNNAKLGTLNAGTGTTQITLNDNATITTINAKDTEGGTINISGSGSITTIVGNSGADTITLSKDIKVTTYTGGTGDDNINLSGATITTLDTNTGNTTISGDTANQGTVNELKTTSGDSHTITVSNATIKKYTAGQKDDTLIVSNGGVIGDTTNNTLNFSGGNNTLMVKSGGDISKLSTITMGDNGNANITIENGATLGTTTINLGTATTTNGKNTFTLYASGDNLSLSGSSSLDEITVSGNTAKLKTITAGANQTDIKLGGSSSITTVDANTEANTINIIASGSSTTSNQTGTIDSITASGSSKHIININDKTLVYSYSGSGNSQNEINVKKGGAIGDITTASGTDTITLEAGSFFMLNKSNQAPTINTGSGDDTITINGILSTTGSNVTIDFGDGTNDTLVLSGDAVISNKITAIKNVNKIDLTNSTATNIDFSNVSGSANSEVTIDKVNSNSTITLSKDNSTKTKVVLEGKNATILNVTSGDKIDFSKVSTELSTAINTGSFTSANTTGSSISASGTYVWHEGMNDFSNAEQVKAKIKDAASNLTSGQKALVAINNSGGNTNDNKSAIYLVEGGNNKEITLDLLGIVGHKIDNQDKLAASGVIEFN
ncbi:putative autotransporter adhesin, DUF4214 domain [Candidatus Campylobacter infans]|uniref:Putative autotransporter adhesin, DUF4214 domain n=1 Tax=Candidatus Campylobacter infans TaxID=2561898 RepID=A0A7H9CHV6_9BACT|nr:DUF4214 domain-containing protein [Candidatus Campylobacter infans]QLI05686.1 putative autotransporter adhesin, DUF4214 domain [Candidatus Campylobacter infans]